MHIWSRILLVFLAFQFKGAMGQKLQSTWSEHPHSKARLIASQSHIREGDEVYLALHIDLDSDWYTYWKNPGDSGARPILKLSHPEGIEFSEVLFPQPERIETSSVSDESTMNTALVSFGYYGEVMFLWKVKPLPETSLDTLTVNLDAEWLVCKVGCIPAFGEFTFTFSLMPSTEKNKEVKRLSPVFYRDQIEEFISKLPQNAHDSGFKITSVMKSEHSSSIVMKTEATRDFIIEDFFPEVDAGLVLSRSGMRLFPREKEHDTVSQKISMIRDPAFKRQKIHVDRLKGLLLVTYPNQNVKEPHYISIDVPIDFSAESNDDGEDWGFISLLFFAFLGGAILNLMPCVFPVVSIKLLSVIKSYHNSVASVKKQCLAYTFGVLTSLQILALAIVILRHVGISIGWGFQLQSSAFVIFLIFLFFILAFYFWGFFSIQLPLSQRVSSLMGKEGVWGQFWTGVLSTVVASPCTAPFMGVAMGVAFSQSVLSIIVIFLFLGLGLSLPYIIFMFYPRFLNFLPGPGEWMVSLSQFMAFPLLGAVVWLLWVLQGLQGTSLVFFTLICLLIAGFAFWFLLRFKKSGFSAIIILLLFVLNLTQASSLKSRFLADHSRDKKSDHSTQSLNWRKFDPAQVQKSLDDQKRVFINFTADWCITCKVNETLVFENAEIISFLKSHDITLYKADWTKRNPEITEQLKKYNRIGVPVYVFFHTADEKPMILPEILTPSSFQKQLIPYVK